MSGMYGEISDKAKKCIYCGKVLVEESELVQEIKCSECGTVLSESDEICLNCGCPVEVSSERMKDNKKAKYKKIINR